MVRSVKVKLQSVNELQTFTSKDYNFLTDIDDLKVGDIVVADTKMGLTLGKVTLVQDSGININATAWIITKVDVEALKERKEKAIKLQRLQESMVERKKVIEQRNTFQALAENDEEMAKLLAEYDSMVK